MKYMLMFLVQAALPVGRLGQEPRTSRNPEARSQRNAVTQNPRPPLGQEKSPDAPPAPCAADPAPAHGACIRHDRLYEGHTACPFNRSLT